MSRANGISGGPREVELKLQMPPGSRAVLETSSAFAAVQATQRHEVTTYFDTPDSALDKGGLTLRVRRIEDVRIQTVKSRVNRRGVAANRNEWEWRIGQNEPDIARLAENPALAKVALAIRGRLQPVFITDIRRTTRLLHLTDNTIVEAAIDEGTVEAGAAREPVSELELELKGGQIGPLYRLAAELQALTPLWISTESKSTRGWHLHTGQTEGARSASMPELRGRARAAEGFHEIIGGTLGNLMANIGPTLRGNVEGLHQMRMELRGSRAALRLFEQHLDAVAAAPFDAELLRFSRLFGMARDWDVFCIDILPAAIADLPGERLHDLSGGAEVERQVAHAAVGVALRGHEFTALVLGLAIWTESGRVQPCTIGDSRMAKRLDDLAPSLLDRVADRAVKRGRHASRLSPVELHQLRKSLKKLFVDVEYLAGLYPRRAVNAYRARCEDLLEILGVANDGVMARRLALALVTKSRPDLANPVRALAKWNKRRGRKALRGLKAALKDFRTTPAFWS